MLIKASFSNVANVLLDWDDVHDDDFCSWRGVFCDNTSLSVLTLYATLSNFHFFCFMFSCTIVLKRYGMAFSSEVTWISI